MSKQTFKRNLTAERLRTRLEYFPSTGKWRWRVDHPNGISAGDEAGYLSIGRWLIRIDGEDYFASRLAWLYTTGEWPERDVDHRDLDPSNDKWINLRNATRSQNLANIRKHRDNTTGHKNVYFRSDERRSPWRVQIKIDGRYVYRRSFVTKKAAISAAHRAREKHFGEFSRG